MTAEQRTWLKEEVSRRRKNQVGAGPDWTVSTHCRKGHQRTDDNTYYWNGYPSCRVCARERYRQKVAA